MKNKKNLILFLPALVQLILAGIAFLGDGYFVFIGLLVVFPILFLMQGILSAMNDINIFLALGISSAGFIAMMFIFLNTSALLYLFIYLSLGIIGYFITKLTKKYFEKAKN